MGLFQAMPDSLCFVGNCFFEKLTLARLLASRGEERQAGELLDRWVWAEGGTPSFVLATLERGRITERLHQRDEAAEFYRFVLDAWRSAGPHDHGQLRATERVHVPRRVDNYPFTSLLHRRRSRRLEPEPDQIVHHEVEHEELREYDQRPLPASSSRKAVRQLVQQRFRFKLAR